MLFRLFIAATLTILSVMLVDDIIDMQNAIRVQQRTQYIRTFEDTRLRYFEAATRKTLNVWQYDPYVYFEFDFYTTQDL